MDECWVDEERLSALLDGELGPVSRRRLARHLMGCEECAARAGRLLGAKLYVGPDQESASLTETFWLRLDQALDLVDAMQARATRKAAPVVRRHRALALAGAGAVLLLVAWLARAASLPQPVSPETMARAHVSMLAEAPSGPLRNVAWDVFPGAPPAAAWLPQAHAVTPEGMTQELFSVSSLPLSLFSFGGRPLDLHGFRPLELDGQDAYVGVRGHTSLLAWQEDGDWRVLAAEVSPNELVLLAGSRHIMRLP